MEKAAEGGRFGAAHVHSYTFVLSLLAGAALVAFAQADLRAGGDGHLRTAFGVQSNGRVWAAFVGGLFVTTFPVSAVAMLYTRYTGLIAFRDDRVGFARSGGQDVANWGGLLTYVAVLYLFAAWVPAGLLTPLRWLAVLVATAVLGVRVSTGVAHRLFHAQFGPPRYELSDVH